MGKVFLVGSGPGDPELLTVKAVRVLGAADVVLHDALVPSAILNIVRHGAALTDVGKRCGHKLLTQDEINALLLHHARSAAVVVRLKGGDPSIFGRGGEEIAALIEAGVQFEVVPGITTALAAAAASKISLTDRRFASSVTLMTAHRDSSEVEWNRLVTSGSTIAIYMPGRDYGALSGHLRRAGLPPETPCVVVAHASLPTEQRLFTTLEQLGGSGALPAPSLVIVGRCASSLEQSDFEHTSLHEDRSSNAITINKELS